MTDSFSLSDDRSRRRVLVIVVGILIVGAIVGAVLILGGSRDDDNVSVTGTPVEEASSTPQPTLTPIPVCADGTVTEKIEALYQALENGELERSQTLMREALAAYTDLMDQPACNVLAQDLLIAQALVSASTAWRGAQASGSVRQLQDAAQVVAQAEVLATAGDDRVKALVAQLLGELELRQAELAELTAPGRVIDEPATLETEFAGGLHPLCEVNTVIKPWLADQSGETLGHASRMVIISDTLYVLTGGQLMMAGLDRVHGPAPAVFLQDASPTADDGIVAGARVDDLVDLTQADNGDLLLLEKSGRVLRRTAAGDWSLERQAGRDEVLVALAPYGARTYVLDVASNQIVRHQKDAGTGEADSNYFAAGTIRDVTRGVDLAIDGAIYAARGDGLVRRYYVGVEDPLFRPDTSLGSPAGVFLPDELDSRLVYVVDGPGRRVLGLDRESGAYRLGFSVNIEGVGQLTSGVIDGGRLYLTDGESLFITILTPEATAAVDCPALPYDQEAFFDQPALAALAVQLPVGSTLPDGAAAYPGGRWPGIGYGVLDGVAFSGLPYSDTVRAIAPGTISRIVATPEPLLETDLAVISTTGRVPVELLDSLWGTQVWIDHGDGIESRYGGLAALLPSLSEGQQVRRLTILGFAGEEPVLLGVWVNGEYLGRGRLVPETVAGYQRLFAGGE